MDWPSGRRLPTTWALTRREGAAILAALFLAAPAFLPGSALAHPPVRLSPDSARAIEGEVLAFRRALAEAAARRDARRLGELYADSFSHGAPTGGRIPREAYLAALAAGEPAIEAAPAAELSIVLHAGGWAAVVTGVAVLRAADGKSYETHWTQMLARRGDEAWQVAASHASRGREITS